MAQGERFVMGDAESIWGIEFDSPPEGVTVTRIALVVEGRNLETGHYFFGVKGGDALADDGLTYWDLLGMLRTGIIRLEADVLEWMDISDMDGED